MERRIFPRANVRFPIEIDRGLSGQVADISETGLSFVIDRSLLLSRLQMNIRLFQDQPINVNCKVKWRKYLFGEGRFQYGVNFVDLENKYIGLIRKAVCSNRGVNEGFIQIAESFERFLKSIKNEFDGFDKNHDSKSQRTQFLESRKNEIFKKIDDYLKRLWSHMEKLDKGNWELYTRYLRAIANYLFINSNQINDHIFRKPLGYPGDFFVANYIFDYNGDHTYLGESSYEMLMNHFACNVPIANSNVKRKNFLKDRILETIERRENAKILSVGVGSARELIELLKEGKLIKKNFTFHCLDFEIKVINYLKREINKITPGKKRYCNVSYINKNFMDLTKNKSVEGMLKNYDLIYGSGIFGYLRDRIATRLVDILFSLLDKNGTLIVCCANNKDGYQRVAYEIMGDWVFLHREKEELMQWVRNIKDAQEISFESISDKIHYSLLRVKAKA